MKRINRFILCFVLSLFVFLTSCDSASSHGIDAYYSQEITPWQENQYIGLHTENKPLDKHELDIYYGLPSGVVFEIFENYANYSAFTDFDHEVKFTIKRRIYESSTNSSTEYKEKDIFTKVDKLSYFTSYDFVYGNNSIKDTISLDDVYDNKGSYGYIKYDWYLTEVDGSNLIMNFITDWAWNSKYGKYIPESRLSVVKSTGALYYTINDNLITFKVAKKSTIYN